MNYYKKHRALFPFDLTLATWEEIEKANKIVRRMLELKGIRRLEEDTYFKRFVKVYFILEDGVAKRTSLSFPNICFIGFSRTMSWLGNSSRVMVMTYNSFAFKRYRESVKGYVERRKDRGLVVVDEIDMLMNERLQGCQETYTRLFKAEDNWRYF